MILIPDIRRQLGDVFSPEQADVLTHVVTEAYDKLVTKSDLHELRVVVREMADAQKITNEQLARTDARLAKTDERLAKLAENVDRRFAETNLLIAKSAEEADRRFAETNERITKLTEQTDRRFAEISEQMAKSAEQTDRRFAELSERMAQSAEQTDRRFQETNYRFAATDKRIDRMAGAIEQLTKQFHRLAIGQDELIGPVHEGKVAAHLYAYVGDVVNRCVVLDSQRKADFFEELAAAGDLTRDELSDLRRADIVATGRLDGEPVVLVVEVSRTGDEDDIDRIARRAAILAKTGRRSIPIVACLRIDEEGIELARERGVWVIRRGRLFNAET